MFLAERLVNLAKFSDWFLIYSISSIHTLTRSRLMSAVIVALSIVAFGFGVATIMLIWFGDLT